MKHSKLIACGLVAWLGMASAAWADIVVVVGAKSPVSTLTKDQVVDIYLGKVREFPSGGVAVTSIISTGAPKDEFFEKVLGKTDSQARAVWARLTFTGKGSAPRELKDSAEVKQLVADNPNIIGFIEKSAVDSHVKVIYAP